MTAYIIVEAVLHDPEKFSAYAKAVPPVVAEYGGEYLVLGGAHTPLEGDWGATRLVMHSWPSAEQAKAFGIAMPTRPLNPCGTGPETSA